MDEHAKRPWKPRSIAWRVRLGCCFMASVGRSSQRAFSMKDLTYLVSLFSSSSQLPRVPKGRWVWVVGRGGGLQGPTGGTRKTRRRSLEPALSASSSRCCLSPVHYTARTRSHDQMENHHSFISWTWRAGRGKMTISCYGRLGGPMMQPTWTRNESAMDGRLSAGKVSCHVRRV